MAVETFVFHKSVLSAIRQLVLRPSHAVLIVGPAGCGKATLGRVTAAKLMEVPENVIGNHPYVTIIVPVDGKAIPIDSIRELQHFLALRIPGDTSRPISRCIIIEDAHLLTTEAQNALLKTLEEPPVGTLIILTAVSTESLLPTIRSRVRILRAVPASTEQLRSYFKNKGYASAEIDKTLLLSGGMPGLATALLTADSQHPLFQATVQARNLLQASTYERLLLIDTLSKQKHEARNLVFILGGMARMAILRSPDPGSKSALRWRQILQASYEAEKQMATNTQAKLVLINLMLAM